MKGVAFVLTVVICFAILGLPVLRFFLGILGVVLGIDADVVVPLSMFLTVVFVVGFAIKSFFIDK
jgi:hypothetical protein